MRKRKKSKIEREQVRDRESEREVQSDEDFKGKSEDGGLLLPRLQRRSFQILKNRAHHGHGNPLVAPSFDIQVTLRAFFRLCTKLGAKSFRGRYDIPDHFVLAFIECFSEQEKDKPDDFIDF